MAHGYIVHLGSLLVQSCDIRMEQIGRRLHDVDPMDARIRRSSRTIMGSVVERRKLFLSHSLVVMERLSVFAEELLVVVHCVGFGG